MESKEKISLLAADFPSLKNKNKKIQKEKSGNIRIERIQLKKDKYVTVYFPFPFTFEEEKIIKNEIKKELNEIFKGDIKRITVVGIGNKSITADSLGPCSAEKIIATRNKEEAKKEISVIKTEVSSKTGIFASEYVEAITKKINSQAVIVIDSLAAKSTKRLYKTLQIANTGILPGSGIKSQGRKINGKNLGIPVISIGVPTVVDVKILAFELTGQAVRGQGGMIVTPAEGDICIEKLSSLIADSINEFTFGF